MITLSKLLYALGAVGGAFLFIYMVRRAAYRQLEGRGAAEGRGARPQSTAR